MQIHPGFEGNDGEQAFTLFKHFAFLAVKALQQIQMRQQSVLRQGRYGSSDY